MKEPKPEVKDAGKKVTVPSLTDCLQAKKSEIVTFLEKVCNKKSKLFWYKKSKLKNAVTLVCHIDTAIGDVDRHWDYKTQKYVDMTVKRRIFFDRKQQVFIGPDGLGADDRAGVFGLCRVWTSLPEELRPNLLFCDEEETGGHGATSAGKLLPELGDSLFLVELDRRGHKDCVFYNQEPSEFVKYVEGFGFKKDFGTFSDVSSLGRDFKLCSTNLSVGYYNEHTRHETLYCKILNATIKKTIRLVAEANVAQKKWELPKTATKRYSYLDGDYYGGVYGGHRGSERFLQRSLHQPVYTEAELEKYPYLRELQNWQC